MKKLLCLALVMIIAISNITMTQASDKIYLDIETDITIMTDGLYTQDFEMGILANKWLTLDLSTSYILKGSEYIVHGSDTSLSDVSLCFTWLYNPTPSQVDCYTLQELLDLDIGYGSWADGVHISAIDLIYKLELDIGGEFLNEYIMYIDYYIPHISSQLTVGEWYDFMAEWYENTLVYIEDQPPLYQQGYSDGYSAGFTAGQLQGRGVWGELIEGTWYTATQRYTSGYNEGYSIGIQEEGVGLNWIQAFFSVFPIIFAIELLPHLSIGMIVGVPIIFRLFFGFLKLIRGG